MALPSLTDIIVVIVLVSPGFISFIVFKWLSIVEKKFSELEIIIYSLIFSLLIYPIFGAITGCSDIDSLRNSIFQPNNVALIVGLGLLFGFIPGGIVRLSLRKGLIREDCWNLCMGRADKSNSWVIVYTKDGFEYKGILHLSGTKGEHSRELVIEKPKLILRDKNGKLLNEIKTGSEILFLQEDIRRVIFFDSLRKS